MILPDKETRVDLLNNKAIASTIIAVLRARAELPITIGVHGDWGAGKSSILEMIEEELVDETGVLCIKFNGWRFQGFEDAKIALLEGIVGGLLEKRPGLSRAVGVVKELYGRIDWLKVARHGGGLAVTAFTGIPTPDLVKAAFSTLRRFADDPKALVNEENIGAAAAAIKSLMKDEAPTKNVPEEVGEFRRAFEQLLKEAGIQQLVVLIDDLDRCLPDTAIETLEAVRLFVFTPHTAFVVAADEAMIEYAVRRHFPELPDTTGPRDYARNYLEKLIQVPFRIPALGEAETRTYLALLLIGADLGEDDEKYRALVADARTRLSRPWEGHALNPSAIKAIFGDVPAVASNALVMSEQVGPILAAGSRGNPRQIKRFLNTLLLRQRIAEVRGFGAAVKLPVLAKLMLAERFLPRVFDQIAIVAAADAEGHCEDLSTIESVARASGHGGVPVGKSTRTAEAPEIEPEQSGGRSKAHGSRAKAVSGNEPAPDSEAESPQASSAVLGEWASSPAVLDWARVDPPLGGVDLRPYLFVAKDRQDYFGTRTALGQLAAVVERLMGPKLSVQTMSAELLQLAPAEAGRAFDALRGRIVGSGQFDQEPRGIPGLTVLVKAQPILQGALISFLETLPSSRLGPWVVTGWGGILTEPDAVGRFDALLERWVNDGGNVALSVAATAARKTWRKGR